jgi:DNA-binding NtrC family response regulator
MRILVVEDEQRIAAFLQKGLQEKHYVVDLAADGETALDLVAVHSPTTCSSWTCSCRSAMGSASAARSAGAGCAPRS